MIFASDLDRTLIYSSSFLKTEIKDITVVEKKNDQDLSHMTDKSIRLLNRINQKIIFIPTTTRSLQQYGRISIFHGRVKPRYAVVANGGIILKQDRIDLNWQKIVKAKAKALISLEKVIQKCDFFLGGEHIKSVRCCDELFIYAVLKDNTLDQDKYEEMAHLCCRMNYSVTRSGRKIYIIPDFINKWEALKYIMDLENDHRLVAAGDSMLDLPMLMNSDYGIIPLHGELNNRYEGTLSQMRNLHFTSQIGLLSTDEFLQEVLELIG